MDLDLFIVIRSPIKIRIESLPYFRMLSNIPVTMEKSVGTKKYKVFVVPFNSNLRPERSDTLMLPHSTT